MTRLTWPERLLIAAALIGGAMMVYGAIAGVVAK